MTAPIALTAWAARHAITPHALADLLAVMGVAPEFKPTLTLQTGSEAWVQSKVRLEAPRAGVQLWRNNVGALKDSRGVPVRYGLANDSADMNKTVKSGDLIGWRSFVIEAHHVGARFAQFVSRECKKVAWSWGEDIERETAQLAWNNLVLKAGGDAKFVQGEGSFL